MRRRFAIPAFFIPAARKLLALAARSSENDRTEADRVIIASAHTAR
jgi:hypothetical protein